MPTIEFLLGATRLLFYQIPGGRCDSPASPGDVKNGRASAQPASHGNRPWAVAVLPDKDRTQGSCVNIDRQWSVAPRSGWAGCRHPLLAGPQSMSRLPNFARTTGKSSGRPASADGASPGLVKPASLCAITAGAAGWSNHPRSRPPRASDGRSHSPTARPCGNKPARSPHRARSHRDIPYGLRWASKNSMTR